ncbi:hypothetical protein BH10PSE9_BH10PSE9_11420 [soil metagenome]
MNAFLTGRQDWPPVRQLVIILAMALFVVADIAVNHGRAVSGGLRLFEQLLRQWGIV